MMSRLFACAANALARGSAIFGLGRVKKPMRSPHGIRSIIRSIIMMASAQQCQQQTAAQGCRRERRQKGSAAAIQTGPAAMRSSSLPLPLACRQTLAGVLDVLVG